MKALRCHEVLVSLPSHDGLDDGVVVDDTECRDRTIEFRVCKDIQAEDWKFTQERARISIVMEDRACDQVRESAQEVDGASCD
jgi:hypothetical protein